MSKRVNHRLALLIFLLAPSFFFASAARAADKGDLYLEAFGALDLDRTRRILAGTTVGYCPWDEIGIGVTFEQVMASKSSDEMESSLRGAVEFRWFLEPWEFWVDTGYLITQLRNVETTNKSGSINLGGAYLFAITPSIAIRLGVHIQFPYTTDGTIFSSAALRILW